MRGVLRAPVPTITPAGPAEESNTRSQSSSLTAKGPAQRGALLLVRLKWNGRHTQRLVLQRTDFERLASPHSRCLRHGFANGHDLTNRIAFADCPTKEFSASGASSSSTNRLNGH